MLDFGRGFARIRETLGEDSQGFMRLWERICKDIGRGSFGGDLQVFVRGFARIRETLGDDLQGFARLWERI